MAVREDGKEAVTHYRLRERFRAHTRWSAASKPAVPTRSACTWRISSTPSSAIRCTAGRCAAQGRHRHAGRCAAFQAPGAACRNAGIRPPDHRRAGARPRRCRPTCWP
jgi:hypothetical protein